MANGSDGRRGFLLGLAAAAAVPGQAQTGADHEHDFLPGYARAQKYKSLKQSSFDTTGGNRDYWSIAAGATREVFRAAGPGVITHLWFTIAARSDHHLKEIVLRGYWDGNDKPSVEAPIGDFFGLNLGQVCYLRIRVPGLLARQVAELVLCDAVPEIGALHGD